MKTILSILLSVFILLCGMHLSIATHICGGEIAAVKWSFSGEMATCGMEGPQNDCPVTPSIATDCCHNNLLVYNTDNNYLPSLIKAQEPYQNIIQFFYSPVKLLFTSISILHPLYKNPPGKLCSSNVSLAGICVFRI